MSASKKSGLKRSRKEDGSELRDFIDKLAGVYHCPLTQEVMVDPATCNTGSVFELGMLRSWFAAQEKEGKALSCPTSKRPANLPVACHTTKKAIELLVLSRSRCPFSDDIPDPFEHWYEKRMFEAATNPDDSLSFELAMVLCENMTFDQINTEGSGRRSLLQIMVDRGCATLTRALFQTFGKDLLPFKELREQFFRSLCRRGHVESLRCFTSSDLMTSKKWVRSALIDAVHEPRSNNIIIIAELKKLFPDVDCLLDGTLLRMACSSKQSNIVELLLEDSKRDISCEYALLSNAVEFSSPKIVGLLLDSLFPTLDDRCALLKPLTDDQYKNTVFHKAARHRDPEMFDVLVSSLDPVGAGTDAAKARLREAHYHVNSAGQNVFHLAASFSRTVLLDRLLRSEYHDAGRSLLDARGRTLLALACINGSLRSGDASWTDTLNVLLAHRPSDLAVADNQGMTPLHHAIASGYYAGLNAVDTIVRNRSARVTEDLVRATDVNGRNFLHLCTSQGMFERVLNDVLQSFGSVIEPLKLFLIEARDINGQTPIDAVVAGMSKHETDDIQEFIVNLERLGLKDAGLKVRAAMESITATSTGGVVISGDNDIDSDGDRSEEVLDEERSDGDSSEEVLDEELSDGDSSEEVLDEERSDGDSSDSDSIS
jgi:ankyrin repeat protein